MVAAKGATKSGKNAASSSTQPKKKKKKYIKPYSIMGTILKRSESGVKWNQRYVHIEDCKMQVWQSKGDFRSKMKPKREESLLGCRVQSLQPRDKNPRAAYPFEILLISADLGQGVEKKFEFAVGSKDRRHLWMRVIKNNREPKKKGDELKEEDEFYESDEESDNEVAESPKAKATASEEKAKAAGHVELPPGADKLISLLHGLQVELRTSPELRDLDEVRDLKEKLNFEYREFVRTHPKENPHGVGMLGDIKDALKAATDLVVMLENENHHEEAQEMLDQAKVALVDLQDAMMADKDTVEMKHCAKLRNTLLIARSEMLTAPFSVDQRAFEIRADQEVARLFERFGEELIDHDISALRKKIAQIQDRLDHNDLPAARKFIARAEQLILPLDSVRRNDEVSDAIEHANRSLRALREQIQ